jgi:hypothetical protein
LIDRADDVGKLRRDRAIQPCTQQRVYNHRLERGGKIIDDGTAIQTARLHSGCFCKLAGVQCSTLQSTVIADLQQIHLQSLFFGQGRYDIAVTAVVARARHDHHMLHLGMQFPQQIKSSRTRPAHQFKGRQIKFLDGDTVEFPYLSRCIQVRWQT